MVSRFSYVCVILGLFPRLEDFDVINDTHECKSLKLTQLTGKCQFRKHCVRLYHILPFSDTGKNRISFTSLVIYVMVR
jgi:hypothetical protein